MPECHECTCRTGILGAPCIPCETCEVCNPCWTCDEEHGAPKNDQCPTLRMRVYRRGLVWYSECPVCVDDAGHPEREPANRWGLALAEARDHVLRHQLDAAGLKAAA